MIFGRIHGWLDHPVTAAIVADHDTHPDTVPEGSVCVLPMIREGVCDARVIPVALAPTEGVECFVAVF